MHCRLPSQGYKYLNSGRRQRRCSDNAVRNSQANGLVGRKGARGIIAPMINTRAEAEAMVRACRYFPLGNRSNAGVRGEWGEFKNYRDYMDAVNNELLIVPMIETNQALENLDAIASVPGVDVLLIGPSDLSIELGVPLDYACDTYQRALDKIAAACAKHGIVAGMYFIPPGMDPNFFVQKGFKFFTKPNIRSMVGLDRNGYSTVPMAFYIWQNAALHSRRSARFGWPENHGLETSRSMCHRAAITLGGVQ
jgi:hypothetical protein